MKVFISGPVSSYIKAGKYEVAKQRFNKVEECFRGLNFEVYNCTNDERMNESTPWRECMDITLDELMTCDIVFMLRGWNSSVGAKREYSKALSLGLILLFE